VTEQERASRYEIVSFAKRKIERTTKLWRYLTFEKFAWLLEKSRLWHTRLDCLNDPFEGSFTKAYVRKRNVGGLPLCQQTGLTPEQEKEVNTSTPYGNFAVCWHESSHETAAMWKLYCSEHAGVAIVSTPQRLKDAVDLTPYTNGVISPVEYMDFEKDDMYLLLGRHAHPAFSKRKSFEHEREVRALIQYWDHSKMNTSFTVNQLTEIFKSGNPRGISAMADLSKLVEEIYISPLAPNYFVDVVKSLAERHSLGNLVRLSTLIGTPEF
jgi:hypothetical protein